MKTVQIEGDESGQHCTGVELESGETLFSDRVVSSADPQTTFLKLIGAQHLEIEFTNRISRLRNRGYVARVNLALSALPTFQGLDSPHGRLIIAPTMVGAIMSLPCGESRPWKVGSADSARLTLAT